MNSLFSLVKDRINFWLLLPLSLLIGILSSTLWIDLDVLLPEGILKKILTLPQPKATILLLLLLLAISACYLLLFLSYTKTPKLKDYDLITPPGFYKHKKRGGYYCQKCLLKDKIVVPLSPISEKEYLCRVCAETYKIDYSVLLNHSYLSIAHDNCHLFNDHHKAVNELILKNKNDC